MMSGQLALTYTLRYQDQASAQASAALRTLERGLGGVQATAAGARAAVNAVDAQLASTGRTGRTAAATAVAVERGLSGVQTAATGAGGALQTVDQRLVTTGRAAADAAAGLERLGASRAPAGLAATGRQVDQTTESIRRMNREAGVGVRALQGLGQITAGAAAARMVVQRPVSETMAYDRRLANLANTAFPDRELPDGATRSTTVAERQAGMRELDAAVIAAVRAGGGQRDAALGALDKLIASGVYKQPSQAMADVPTLQRFSSAADAEAGTLADIAIRARQSLGLTNITRVLDQSMRAGQLGGFELKDMARWLPQQMAMGRTAGLAGEEGLRVLLAANQAAVTTAGSKDEAGNNVVNLLAKINAQDTANDAKKLGINLSGSLAAARAKGVNGLDAFVNLVEQIVAKDKQFTALRDKSRRATGDEQRAMYGSMADILQGGAVGKLVQDRQALLALVGIMGNRKGMESIRDELTRADGTGERAFELVKETPAFKAEMAAAEKAIAMQKALDQVNPLLGDLADKAAGLAREFPNLSAAVVAAATTISAIAAGAGVAAVAGRVLGWGGVGAGAGAAAAAAAGGGGAGAAGAAAAGAAGAGGAAAAAAGGGAAAAAMAALLSLGSLVAGGALGSTLYQMGRGTKVGDGFGDFVLEAGAFFGSQKAREDLAVIRQLEAAATAQQAAAERLAELAAGVTQRPPLVVQLDGREIYSSVSDIADDAARRR